MSYERGQRPMATGTYEVGRKGINSGIRMTNVKIQNIKRLKIITKKRIERKHEIRMFYKCG